MIDTSSGGPVFTTTYIPAQSEVTFYFQLYVTNSSSSDKQYALHMGGNEKIGSPGIWVESGKLWYSNWDHEILFGATAGRWTCPITDGHHIVGVKFNMSDQRIMDPVIFIDGTSQTITEEQTPSGSVSHLSDVINFGGYFFYNYLWGPWLSEGRTWQGKIGEFSLHSGLHTDDQMARMTRLNIKRKPMDLESSSLLYYFPFDEVADQVQLGNSRVLTPNGDVNALWNEKTLGTYWQSIAVDNETDYIRATGVDDNEEQIFDLSTFTLAANETVYGVRVILKGLHSDVEECNVYLYVDGSPENLGGTSFDITTTEGVKFWRGSLTQSQIDGLQIGLKVGTVDKGEYLQISYLSVKVVTADNKWDDWVGGLYAVSQDAVGWGEMNQTYP